MTLTPAYLTDEERSVLRPVALAYRRAYRAGAGQGEYHDTALREYRRLCRCQTQTSRRFFLDRR
jgi:hypothetical protein